MDLHVGDTAYIELPTAEPLNPYSQESINTGIVPVYWEEREGHKVFYLNTMERALLHSTETILVPESKIGFIELRSTWARMGLLGPPTVADPGFRGELTFEIFNCSSRALMIPAGIAMWSIHWVSAEEPLYRGRYQGQIGVQFPIAFREV